MPWNPHQYLGFQQERLRPALDLLNAIPDLPSAKPVIIDLGCGPGHLSELLTARWPESDYTGIDDSQSMLSVAQGNFPQHRWICSSIQHWKPTAPPDLIFSNAALHWLDDHQTLFPRLMRMLKPGGVLAVQMPNNFLEYSHQIAFAIARTPAFQSCLAHVIRPQPVHDPVIYHEWLTPFSDGVSCWQTQYFQVLRGANPVADWTRGSLLVPILDALGPELGEVFEKAYREQIAMAYPSHPDGWTWFPFKRLFVMARKRV